MNRNIEQVMMIAEASEEWSKPTLSPAGGGDGGGQYLREEGTSMALGDPL